MPLSPSDLTHYHLDYTDGRFALLGTGDLPMVSLLPVQLISINESRRHGQPSVTTPVFVLPGLGEQGEREHTIDKAAILYEPHELPAVLRDMLWPPSDASVLAAMDADPSAPVAPPFADAGNIDDEPVPAGSSDYDGPAF